MVWDRWGQWGNTTPPPTSLMTRWCLPPMTASPFHPPTSCKAHWWAFFHCCYPPCPHQWAVRLVGGLSFRCHARRWPLQPPTRLMTRWCLPLMTPAPSTHQRAVRLVGGLSFHCHAWCWPLQPPTSLMTCCCLPPTMPAPSPHQWAVRACSVAPVLKPGDFEIAWFWNWESEISGHTQSHHDSCIQ